MGDPKQQRLGRVDRMIVGQSVDANISFLHQILDIFRPGSEFAQIPVQRRAVAENLIQKPVMSLIGHWKFSRKFSKRTDLPGSGAR